MAFKNFLANADRGSTPLYVCGDFIFPDINWDFQVAPGSDNLPSMFCDVINDSFLTQMNHALKRITDNSRNILDLVFTNQPERVCGLTTFDCQLATDHLGVQFYIKTITKRARVSRFVYDFKKADFEGLRQSLSAIQLAPVVQTLDNAIHRINHYPADKYYRNQLRYPLDRDLSGG